MTTSTTAPRIFWLGEEYKFALPTPRPKPATRPMRAALYLKLLSTWAGMRTTGQHGGWGKPLEELDLRLDGRYVRILGYTPKRRHVHYEVLRPRRRKNQAPTRHWMRTKQFMQAATVCGHFSRLPDGELTWIEPVEAAVDVR